MDGSPAIRDAIFAAIDFESAGAAPGEHDAPIQVAWAILENSRIDPGQFFRSYLASKNRISWAARRTHGISESDLAGAPPLLALWPKFRAALGGRVMVAHGAATEQRFLRAFPLHGFGPWVDTLVLARAVYPTLPSFALGDVLGSLGITAEVESACPGLTWHDALFDAVACLVFLRHVVRRAAIEDAPLDLLLHPDASPYYARLHAAR